jgi:hypothetical protein
MICFNYGQIGHFANRCPDRHQQSTQAQEAAPIPNHDANSTPAIARQNFARGCINHMAIADTQEAPDVVLGMSLIKL